MTKIAKIITVALILGGLTVPISGCGAKSDTASTLKTEVATVQSGNITTEITAAGNLALSETQDLPIDLFYQGGTVGRGGTVGEVLVEVGDTVKEGQVLVTVDKDEWNDQLATLETNITNAERNLLSAQANLLTEQQTLESTRDTAAEEKTVRNDEVSLQEAQDNLDAGVTATDYQAAEAALNRAKAYYNYVQNRLRSVSDGDDWLLALETAKEKLDTAQTNYDNALSGYDSHAVALLKKKVEIAEMTLAADQKALADVPQDIAMQEMQVTLYEGKVADAQKALEDAQNKLADAQSKNPEIKAPFDGFITAVNVKAGDNVYNGTIAVTLADPNKFEAAIVVSEMDILSVKLDGEAQVEVAAIQGMSFPAKVTQISPTATISSGVVNYKVKVELQSLQAVAQERQGAKPQAMADIAAGEIPAPLQQAIDEGKLTREQVEEMMKQGPPAGMEMPPGFTPQAGLGEAATSQVAAALPEDFQLREGLTVTVTIVVDERTDILLVPNAAITSEGGESYVQVVSSTGEIEKRAVQTGINDYQFTEITDGLSEGEKIIVPEGTVTTTSSQDEPPRMGLFGPR